jgi:hypothetical protein
MIKDPNTSKEKKSLYEVIAKLDFSRQIIKKVIMTIPYNASRPTLNNSITEFFTKEGTGKTAVYTFIENPSIKCKYEHINLFVSIINDVIDSNFPITKKLINYLNQMAKVITTLSLPIP